MSLVLEVRLFGRFDVRSDGVSVVPTSGRARSFLAYLVLHRGTPQRREYLAHLLWPDSGEQQARTNLRHVLHTVRSAVPGADRHLHATAGTLAWRGGWDDVSAFEAAVARAAGSDAAGSDAAGDVEEPLRALREASALHTGDLLQGWDDEWVVPERERLRRIALGVLVRLRGLLAGQGDLAGAIACAEQALTTDRLDEETYRALMQLHEARGDRARAVRVYHECAAALEDELGVEPSAQTRAVYEGLLPRPGAAPRPPGVAPLVGRRDERQRLIDVWEDACSGRAQLVVVTGEPGIGKSRLVEEFRHWAARRGTVTAAARSYVAEGTLAFAPVVEWLCDPVVAARRARLEPSRLAALGWLLPELPPGPDAADPGSRLRLFDAAAHALVAGADPVLLVADDLQAADPQTLEFVHYLLRSRPEAPLLVVATARPADTDPAHPLHGLLAGLRALDRCTELELGRFARSETAVLAERLGFRLAATEVDRLHAETEGNPLFVVESLRAGRPGTDGPGELAPKVQAVLRARLEQLSAGARDLVGLAATAGSSVPVDLLLRAAPDDDEERVTRDLDELWRRQVLLAAGAAGYAFSHDKLRDVAYRALSPARRRRHHRALARALQEAGADRLDTVAGQVAAHLDDAGARDDAVAWYQRAAVAAQRLYADADAARSLRRAWEIVRAEPPSGPGSGSGGGSPRELEILTALVGPLAAAEGYASQRLGTVLDRAFEVGRRLGVPLPAPLVRARAMAVLSRSDFDAALEYGAELRARGDSDGVLAVEGDFVQGVAASWRGEFAAASRHFEAALSRYRPEHRSAHLLSFAHDPEPLCLVRLAHVRLLLGERQEAVRLRDRAIARANAAGHPFTLAAVLIFAALVDLDLDLGLDPAGSEALRERISELESLRDRVDAPPIRLSSDAFAGLLDVLDDAGRDAGPGAGRARTGRRTGRRTGPGDRPDRRRPRRPGAAHRARADRDLPAHPPGRLRTHRAHRVGTRHGPATARRRRPNLGRAGPLGAVRGTLTRRRGTLRERPLPHSPRMTPPGSPSDTLTTTGAVR